MQIVINIHDNLYNNLKNGCGIYPYRLIYEAIANGTILPKGHGRLKDFDKIEWYGCDFEGRGCIEAKGDCSVCNHANLYAKQVRGLPTIIEADKES